MFKKKEPNRELDPGELRRAAYLTATGRTESLSPRPSKKVAIQHRCFPASEANQTHACSFRRLARRSALSSARRVLPLLCLECASALLCAVL
eukprot:2953835-Rhodomonas_salina.1